MGLSGVFMPTHNAHRDIHRQAKYASPHLRRPYAAVHNSGVPNVIQILKELLATRTQTELAAVLGVKQSTISRWLDGAQPKFEQVERLVRMAMQSGIITADRLERELLVPVVGYAGAGGAIDYTAGQGPFGDAPMPPGAPKTTVAVVVRGDSMAGQLEDGWTIYYDNRHEPPTPTLFGKLCVVGLADGRVLVRRLYPGRKEGHYDLQPTNAPMMLDCPVVWAAKITWIAPT